MPRPLRVLVRIAQRGNEWERKEVAQDVGIASQKPVQEPEARADLLLSLHNRGASAYSRHAAALRHGFQTLVPERIRAHGSEASAAARQPPQAIA